MKTFSCAVSGDMYDVSADDFFCRFFYGDT